MRRPSRETTLINCEPRTDEFLDEVLDGMRRPRRHLPCKYFYDERGSRLFDEICELDEYYLTRTELSIMRRYASEMAEGIGHGVMLVEYGSGSSVKTRILLDHLLEPVAYVPVDISREHLQETADRLSRAYPDLEVLPVCADFTGEFVLPVSRRTPTHTAAYFPGSTIGNFHHDAASAMLARIAPLCGAGGGLLIGIDLQKDTRTIEAAYNDARGVTAEFNRNLLHRVNRELDADFDVDEYEHRARYSEAHGRVEISLVSQRHQVVSIGGESFDIERDEAICTEYSYKYTVGSFERMAADVGLTLRAVWTDERHHFGVLHFVVLN